MQQHEMPVVSLSQVYFIEVGVKRASFPNSGKGVFGGVAGCSSMPDAKG
jgi:hypothetical protein